MIKTSSSHGFIHSRLTPYIMYHHLTCIFRLLFPHQEFTFCFKSNFRMFQIKLLFHKLRFVTYKLCNNTLYTCIKSTKIPLLHHFCCLWKCRCNSYISIIKSLRCISSDIFRYSTSPQKESWLAFKTSTDIENVFLS